MQWVLKLYVNIPQVEGFPSKRDVLNIKQAKLVHINLTFKLRQHVLELNIIEFKYGMFIQDISTAKGTN
jgi:hypothetical protein